jgi:parallel beta-helix repeat protein
MQPALLLSALLAFTSFDAQAAVLTVDCTVGPFLTIGAAVTAAANGDTIVVHPCSAPYNENVHINSFDDLHLVGAKAPTVVGAGPVGVGTLASPPVVIDGSGLPGGCIEIFGSTSVSVTGFTVRNCRSGLMVVQSFDTVVTNVRAQGHLFASYYESGATGSRVAGNLFAGSQYGVYLQFNDDATITDNRVGLNSVSGIYVAGRRNLVVGNEVVFNGQDGVHVTMAGLNRIERNRVVSNMTSGGGVANIYVDATTGGNDVVGNDTAGSLVDLAFSDLAENI